MTVIGNRAIESIEQFGMLETMNAPKIEPPSRRYRFARGMIKPKPKAKAVPKAKPKRLSEAKPRNPVHLSGESAKQRRLDDEAYGLAHRRTNKIREIYFVRAVTLGLIKIGVANWSIGRITSLQTASPDKLEEMGVVLCGNFGTRERWIHEQFAHLRSHGEWFRPGVDLLAWIAQHAMNPEEAGRERSRLNRIFLAAEAREFASLSQSETEASA